MIQASINQLLQMAAIGAKLDPRAEKRAEIYQTKKTGEDLQRKEELLTKEALKVESEGYKQIEEVAKMSNRGASNKAKKADEYLNATATFMEAAEIEKEATLDISQRRVENAKELFELDPSEKNYRAYRDLKEETDYNTEAVGAFDPVEIATKKAREALKVETDRIRKAKRGGK